MHVPWLVKKSTNTIKYYTRYFSNEIIMLEVSDFITETISLRGFGYKMIVSVFYSLNTGA